MLRTGLAELKGFLLVPVLLGFDPCYRRLRCPSVSSLDAHILLIL